MINLGEFLKKETVNSKQLAQALSFYYELYDGNVFSVQNGDDTHEKYVDDQNLKEAEGEE